MIRDLAFATKDLEKRFEATIRHFGKEEIGGILFWNWGHINNLHWRRHQAIFGMKAIALITDWLICPNTSNLRHRMYAPSDLGQLIGIAEQTAESRGCMFTHFHSHPSPTSAFSFKPSDADKSHWQTHWKQYYQPEGAIAVADDYGYLHLHCYSGITRNGKTEFIAGDFLHWWYINRKIKAYEAKRMKGGGS